MRSRFLAWLMLLVWLAGLLTVLAWFLVNLTPDWRFGLACLFVLAGGMAARAGWKRAPGGQLAWSGDSWRWESPSYQTGSTEQKLSVIADLQHMLLLRIENQSGASLWLWLERATLPERWLDLRRAVFSPHRSAVLQTLDVLPEEAPVAPVQTVAVSGAMLSKQAPRGAS